MLTCMSPASVLRRTRSAPRPSSVCSAATTTSSAAVRSAAWVSRPAGGNSRPPITSNAAQLSTASKAVISGAERLQSFHCRRPVRSALCDMRILIVRVLTVRGPDQARPRSGVGTTDSARVSPSADPALRLTPSPYRRSDQRVRPIAQRGFRRSTSFPTGLGEGFFRVSLARRGWPRGSAPALRRRIRMPLSPGERPGDERRRPCAERSGRESGTARFSSRPCPRPGPADRPHGRSRSPYGRNAVRRERRSPG